ncbi:hypothetical protein DRP05_09880 [Archaeoglobales archaeon]|nr:MAG: hypothetical protein DRP05_09880 [Archaeoglobales archaeon]
MEQLKNQFQLEVSKKFRRFDFHPVQRKLYSYDLSEPPKLLKRFLGIADVVIQPESKEEVYEILKIAKKYRMPVIPRGSATSAYGGVLPYKGGIVVDFTRLNDFEVDEDKKLLISGAGVVWWDVQKELVKRGLSLRVYPTSAPSSTVGGWIGQGGYGVGSLKYGSIAENVEWVEVVDFNGIGVKEPSKFVGLEGTTGLIVSAAIKLKDYDDDRALAFNVNIEDSIKLMSKSKAHTAFFYNDKYVELLKETRSLKIDDGNILLLTFESVSNTVSDGDEEVGELLWQDRFYPFRMRKISNLICVEVVLPIQKLIDFSKKIEKLPFIVMFSKTDALILILLTVQGEVKYSTWLQTMKLIKIAEKYNGKVYSPGLWFSYKSDKLLSNFEVLRSYKREVDEYNLLNPGKIFPFGPIHRLIKLADLVVR